MVYCSQCGATTVRMVPSGDHRERDYCSACGTVHYENPKLVVGCILEWRGLVLLCKRAIEPRVGFWTLPAGFLENGESLVDGALRETHEEAGAEGRIDALFAVVDVPEIHQVHMFFRGSLLAERLAPGPESMEAGLFEEAAIPWNDLAFHSVRFALERFVKDRKGGGFGTHTTVLRRNQSSR